VGQESSHGRVIDVDEERFISSQQENMFVSTAINVIYTDYAPLRFDLEGGSSVVQH
jgi:hypothetical protein